MLPIKCDTCHKTVFMVGDYADIVEEGSLVFCSAKCASLWAEQKIKGERMKLTRIGGAAIKPLVFAEEETEQESRFHDLLSEVSMFEPTNWNDLVQKVAAENDDVPTYTVEMFNAAVLLGLIE